MLCWTVRGTGCGFALPGERDSRRARRDPDGQSAPDRNCAAAGQFIHALVLRGQILQQANGLTLVEIGELLGFRDRGGRDRCRQIQKLLDRKIEDLDVKLAQLQEFKQTLLAYRRECEQAQNRMTEECPVVEHFGRRRR